MTLGSRGILADEMAGKFADRRLDRFEGAVQRRLAPADQPVIGLDPHEHPVAPVDPVFERFNLGDLHGAGAPPRVAAPQRGLA